MSNYLRDGETFRVMPDGSTVKLDSDGNPIVRDREVMRVPMILMDSGKGDMIPSMQPQTPTFDASKLPKVNVADHRPGYLKRTSVQDAQSVASHYKMVERTSNAWKNPQPQQDSPQAVVRNTAMTMAAPAPDAAAAHDRMRARQENAWRTPKPRID